MSEEVKKGDKKKVENKSPLISPTTPMEHEEHEEITKPVKTTNLPQRKQKTPPGLKFAPGKALNPTAFPVPKATEKPVVKPTEKPTKKTKQYPQKYKTKYTPKQFTKPTVIPPSKQPTKPTVILPSKQPTKPTVIPPSKQPTELETPQTPITDQPEEELTTSPVTSTTPRPAHRYITSPKELTTTRTPNSPVEPKREKFTLNVEGVDADFKHHLETKTEEVLKMMDTAISCCQSRMDAIEQAMNVREIFLLVLISLITSSKQ